MCGSQCKWTQSTQAGPVGQIHELRVSEGCGVRESMRVSLKGSGGMLRVCEYEDLLGRLTGQDRD